jgi:hypothetical protein
MGHRRFLGKKHPYRAMDCQFNGEKENREASLHMSRDLVHLKVQDTKTIEKLSKLTEKPLAKERNEMVKKKESGTINQFYGSYWPMLDVRHSIDNMHVKKNEGSDGD